MSLKILTIDDSKTIRLIVARAFKNFDCTVLEAPNGVVGLAVATREKPDLILLDYTMPMMDGFEVLARLRSDPELKSTPVIMLTAEAGRETVVKIAKLGVRDYLIKPFKEDLIVERVGRVLMLKPRTQGVSHAKRFDDPLQILVVDDKPAIAAQISAALIDTSWKTISVEQTGQALDTCMKHAIDLVLVSLSLPNDGAYLLFQSLRSLASSSSIPVFGLSVRTAAAEQARAQQVGFSGLIGKPIDPAELKTKISRALRLETSYKYFQAAGSTLVLKLPKDVPPSVANEIGTNLVGQLTNTADAGGDRLVIDLCDIEKATLPVIELILSAIEVCSKLSLRYAIAASAAIKADCAAFEETQDWVFAPTLDQAAAVLNCATPALTHGT